MKFKIAKSDLENALSVARLSVSSADDLSGHYLFRLKEGQVEVLSHELAAYARAPLTGTEVEGEEGEAFTCQAKRMDQWLTGALDTKALTLSSDGKGEVVLKDARSRIRLQSLDAAKFPYWDDLLSRAKEVGVTSPTSFARALDCSQWFVYTDNNDKPELCQVEAREGVMWATDRRAISSVSIPRLPGLSVRIPDKVVGPLNRFLADKITLQGPVSVLEAERPFEEGGGACAVFRRPDGSYLGISRPTINFPDVAVNRDTPSVCSLRINKLEFSRAIAVLRASAAKDRDTLVTFHYDEKKGVSLSMPCAAGGEDFYSLEGVEVLQQNEVTLPDGTPVQMWSKFTIEHIYISGIVKTFNLDSITLGVHPRDRAGYVTFQHEDEEEDGNSYFSAIIWRV